MKVYSNSNVMNVYSNSSVYSNSIGTLHVQKCQPGVGEGYHVMQALNCLTSHSLHCSPSFFSTCFGEHNLLSQEVLGALLHAVELFFPLGRFQHLGVQW
jgi:hypothetical protein